MLQGSLGSEVSRDITRVVCNLAFAREKKWKSAISGHFLLIFLYLGQKRAGKKAVLNPGTRASLVKVLAKVSPEPFEPQASEIPCGDPSDIPVCRDTLGDTPGTLRALRGSCKS